MGPFGGYGNVGQYSMSVLVNPMIANLPSTTTQASEPPGRGSAPAVVVQTVTTSFASKSLGAGAQQGADFATAAKLIAPAFASQTPPIATPTTTHDLLAVVLPAFADDVHGKSASSLFDLPTTVRDAAFSHLI